MQEPKVPFGKLPQNYQNRLCEVYGRQPESGYSAHRIEYVRALTAYEAWFFGNGNFLSPNFLTQTLYKLKGTISPLRFNRVLREADQREDVFRTNYCDMGDRVLAVVCKARKHTEPVIYNNLQGREPEEINAVLRKAAGAALRYPFDVEKGELLRIFVCHTDKDEYAVMVTAAQIIMERFDVRALVREAMGQPETVLEQRTAPPLALGAQMELKMFEYWKRLLAAPPSPVRLPGELDNVPAHPYKQKACRLVLPVAFFSNLTAETKGSRMPLMSLLATAWGLLLQALGYARDICYCLIVPQRGVRKDDAWRPFCMVPVRQTAEKSETVERLVARQFQQFIVSQPYACFDWKGFGNLLGGEGKPFNHFLDFNDFLAEEKPFSEYPAKPEGNVVAQHSWDAHSMKLSLYFRYNKEKVSVIFLYDEDSFEPEMGEHLVMAYHLTLQNMLADQYETVASFHERLMGRIQAEKKTIPAFRAARSARLQNAVSSIPLLQGTAAGLIQLFMKHATILDYYEGDIIGDMDDDLLFVAEGKFVRSITDGEGWYRPLGIAKKGAWLNESAMLAERKAPLVAEVVSERAAVLAIPQAAMENILAMHPGLWKNITCYAIAQLETYQRLWVQS